MMIGHLRAAFGALFLLQQANSCTPPPSFMPQPPPQRAPAQVNASFGKVWDAVIERFADDNIGIRTLERASGFVASEPMNARGTGALYADCGTYGYHGQLAPETAAFNILVRGDSIRSTIKATVRWSTTV